VRNSLATRVVSCSPLNFEYDFNFGLRGGFDSVGCSSTPTVTHTVILTE